MVERKFLVSACTGVLLSVFFCLIQIPYYEGPDADREELQDLTNTCLAYALSTIVMGFGFFILGLQDDCNEDYYPILFSLVWTVTIFFHGISFILYTIFFVDAKSRLNETIAYEEFIIATLILEPITLCCIFCSLFWGLDIYCYRTDRRYKVVNNLFRKCICCKIRRERRELLRELQEMRQELKELQSERTATKESVAQLQDKCRELMQEIYSNLPELETPNCPICFEELSGNTLRILDCQHSFHVACIEQWFEINNNCPICRAPSP